MFDPYSRNNIPQIVAKENTCSWVLSVVVLKLFYVEFRIIHHKSDRKTNIICNKGNLRAYITALVYTRVVRIICRQS